MVSKKGGIFLGLNFSRKHKFNEASGLNSTKHLGMANVLPQTPPPSRSIYQSGFKQETMTENMDRMVEDLKNSIKKNTQEMEEPMLQDKIQFEMEQEHEPEHYRENMVSDSFTNDYFLGKRDPILADSSTINKDLLQFPAKKQVTESENGFRRQLRLDDSVLSISKQNSIPLNMPKEELQTPKPYLNISLIDQTYKYKPAIQSMWDDQGSQKDQLFAPQSTIEDPMDEFQYRDEL